MAARSRVPGRIAGALPAQKLNRFAAALPNDAARVADLRFPRMPSFRIELDGALKSLILIVFSGKPAAFPDPHRGRATPVARGLVFALRCDAGPTSGAGRGTGFHVEPFHAAVPVRASRRGAMPMTRRLEALPSRRPEEASPRMWPLSRLPVFLSLEGKRAVVCGDAAAAAWKAELLSAAGARVDVFSDAPSEELRALAAAPPQGAISIEGRAWQASDFAGAAVAIGAMTEDTEAQRFAAAARGAGIPVNVIDKPRLLRFHFRRDRQPVAAGDRHFDRRHRTGVRPGDPRQDRRPAAARLCPLGRGGAPLACAGAGDRPPVRGAPALLATVHRHRRIEPGSRAGAPAISMPCSPSPAPTLWRAPGG